MGLLVLAVLLKGGFPRWHYSRNRGYASTGGLGLLVVIVLVILVVTCIPRSF